MPDRVKEKLVELLKKAICGEIIEDKEKAFNAIADYLIANGGTVQSDKDINVPNKWISVKERLPKDNSNVLGCLKIGEESRIYPAFYAHGEWWDCIFNETTTNSTTHWMPLPQPPKGE